MKKMIEGKVIKDFNDIENDLKKYTVGKKFKAENSRYIELFDNGFVSEGKEVTAESNKQVSRWQNMIGSNQKKNIY